MPVPSMPGSAEMQRRLDVCLPPLVLEVDRPSEGGRSMPVPAVLVNVGMRRGLDVCPSPFIPWESDTAVGRVA